MSDSDAAVVVLEQAYAFAVLHGQAAVLLAEVDGTPVVTMMDMAPVVQTAPQTAQLQTALEQPTMVLAAGEQGPQGIQGVPGAAGGQIVQRIAGIPLSAHRAVYQADSDNRIRYASYTDDTVAEVLGITTSAAGSAGALVNVQLSGELFEPSFNFQPGPVFLASDGLLTQFPASSIAVLQIGVAITPQTLLIRIQQPTYLI